MAFIPVTNVAQINVRYTVDGEQCENTLYGRFTGGTAPTSIPSMCTAVRDWWLTYMKPLQCNIVTLREIYAFDLTTSTGFTYSLPVTSANVGTRAGNAMPNNVALHIVFRTVLRGRSYRGGNYISAMGETDVANNSITESYVNNVVDAYTELISVFDGLEFVWVVVSRYSNNQPRVTGVSTEIISVVAVDTNVDSMRRRLPGRGR